MARHFLVKRGKSACKDLEGAALPAEAKRLPLTAAPVAAEEAGLASDVEAAESRCAWKRRSRCRRRPSGSPAGSPAPPARLGGRDRRRRCAGRRPGLSSAAPHRACRSRAPGRTRAQRMSARLDSSCSRHVCRKGMTRVQTPSSMRQGAARLARGWLAGRPFGMPAPLRPAAEKRCGALRKQDFWRALV